MRAHIEREGRRSEDKQSENMGRLAQAVETLTEEVASLKAKVDNINGQLNRGKGFALGMVIAAGGVGAGVSSAFHKIFGNG